MTILQLVPIATAGECRAAAPRAVLILLAAVLACLWSNVAWGQTPFVVTGVEVDATAEDANAAREIAHASGMAEALDRLLRRITPSERHDGLPRPDPDVVRSMVFGLDVRDERTSRTRYLANLTIRFSRDAVRTLLRNAAIPFAETLARPRLVLPVYRVAGAHILWDDPNPWREAWGVVSERDSVTPLVVPRGDLTDVALIGAAQAARRDPARLSAIASHYGVRGVLVAEASLRFEIGSRAPRIDVTLTTQGPGGGQPSTAFFLGAAGEPVPELLARAVVELVVGIEESWKRDTLIAFDAEGEIAATVALTAAGDWAELRRRLEAAPEVKSVRLAEISRTQAVVAVRHYGDIGRLGPALGRHDLELRESHGEWTIRLLPDGAR